MDTPLNSLGKKPQIMVIDDEEILLETISIITEGLGCKTIRFLTGKEALHHYKQAWQQIDLVILDLVIPDIKGEEVLVELKKINPEAKILVSSGYLKPDSFDELNQLGACCFLAKPFNMAELTEHIQKAFALK